MEEGFEVVDEKNGQLGLDHLDDHAFDLIVSDLEMPVVDGWDFIRNFRKEFRQLNVPAIALTSLDTEEARLKARESGFDYYEVKLDREHFINTVKQALTLPAAAGK